MSKNPNLPESVQEELDGYVTQLSATRATVIGLAATDQQREVVTEIDTLLSRCQTPGLANAAKPDELCELSDRVMAVQDRSLAIGGRAHYQNAPSAALPK